MRSLVGKAEFVVGKAWWWGSPREVDMPEKFSGSRLLRECMWSQVETRSIVSPEPPKTLPLALAEKMPSSPQLGLVVQNPLQ